MPRSFRIAVLLVAIFAILGVSMAAESATHFHAKPPASGCDICFTAHLAAGPAGSSAPPIQAPQPQGQYLSGPAIAGYRFLHSTASLTRGPPAAAL